MPPGHAARRETPVFKVQGRGYRGEKNNWKSPLERLCATNATVEGGGGGWVKTSGGSGKRGGPPAWDCSSERRATHRTTNEFRE